MIRVIVAARRNDADRVRGLRTYRFRVVGIFETGFFEIDANWAYVDSAAGADGARRARRCRELRSS